MRKLFCLLALAAIAGFSSYAQKTNVAVGEVKAGSGVTAERAEMLRSLIISGLSSQSRLNVSDALKGSSSGAAYLISANFNSMSGSSTYSYKYGYSYKAEMQYVITITDIAKQSVLGTITKTHYGNSDKSSEAAFANSLTLVESDMKSLVDEYFRLSGKIATIDQTNPKKGLVTFYLDLGSDAGIAVGNALEIFQIVEIAGQSVKKSIGTAKVKEVNGASLSFCNVTKGGVDILNAYNNNVEIVVESKPNGSIIPGLL